MSTPDTKLIVGNEPPLSQDEVLAHLSSWYFAKDDADKLIDGAIADQAPGEPT